MLGYEQGEWEGDMAKAHKDNHLQRETVVLVSALGRNCARTCAQLSPGLS